jgi:hypothetical protein
MTTDIRPYLQIRTATPSGFNRTGDRLLVASNLSGTTQVHRLDLDDGTVPPVAVADLTQVTRDMGWPSWNRLDAYPRVARS